MSTTNDIIVYTDGACLGNPGKGGWAAVILNDQQNIELCGGFRKTTNNRMEYLAAIKALEYLEGASSKIIIHTDSKLLHDTMTKWIFGWKKKGWKKADGKLVLNLDLVERLDQLTQKLKVSWQKVPAHVGLEYNELCDQLAGSAAIDAKAIDYVFENLPDPNNSTKATSKPANEMLFSKEEKIVDLRKSTSVEMVEIDSSISNNSAFLAQNEKLILNVLKKDCKLQLELYNKTDKSKVTYLDIDNVPEFLFTILKKYDE